MNINALKRWPNLYAASIKEKNIRFGWADSNVFWSHINKGDIEQAKKIRPELFEIERPLQAGDVIKILKPDGVDFGTVGKEYTLLKESSLRRGSWFTKNRCSSLWLQTDDHRNAEWELISLADEEIEAEEYVTEFKKGEFYELVRDDYMKIYQIYVGKTLVFEGYANKCQSAAFFRDDNGNQRIFRVRGRKENALFKPGKPWTIAKKSNSDPESKPDTLAEKQIAEMQRRDIDGDNDIKSPIPEIKPRKLEILGTATNWINWDCER